MKYKIGQFKHQKTALADGFNASVGSKLSIVSQAGLTIIYHKITKMSNIKKCLRGPDGSRTRTSCLRYRQSTVNLPAQFTEAQLFSQILIQKGISQNGIKEN